VSNAIKERFENLKKSRDVSETDPKVHLSKLRERETTASQVYKDHVVPVFKKYQKICEDNGFKTDITESVVGGHWPGLFWSVCDRVIFIGLLLINFWLMKKAR